MVNQDLLFRWAQIARQIFESDADSYWDRSGKSWESFIEGAALKPFHDNKDNIIVENTYDGSMQKQDRVFLSTKEKIRKGIGIISVIDVTKKYRGIPRFEYDG